MAKVRGVRFSDKEDTLIEEFLRKNPLIDFSTLAKISILEFVRNPQLNLTPVGKSTKRENKDVRPIS